MNIKYAIIGSALIHALVVGAIQFSDLEKAEVVAKNVSEKQERKSLTITFVSNNGPVSTSDQEWSRMVLEQEQDFGRMGNPTACDYKDFPQITYTPTR